MAREADRSSQPAESDQRPGGHGDQQHTCGTPGKSRTPDTDRSLSAARRSMRLVPLKRVRLRRSQSQAAPVSTELKPMRTTIMDYDTGLDHVTGFAGRVPGASRSDGFKPDVAPGGRQVSLEARGAMIDLIPRLRAFAISLTGNVDRADDLVQET